MNKDNPLLNLIFKNRDNLLTEIKALLDAGANPNEITKYSETPLRSASVKGRFDVVKLLFEYGANPEHLNWTKLFHTIAYGTIENVKQRLELKDAIDTRDTWDRTPFLLAVQTGELDKVRILLEAGANIFDKWRNDKNAVEIAILSDDYKMLQLLLKGGLSSEAYNEFGYTPLIHAADVGAVQCVKVLIDLNVDIFKKDRSQFSRETAIAHTRNLKIVKLLLEHGADLSDLNYSSSARLELIGLNKQKQINVSDKVYFAEKNRTYGKTNPELCKKLFWYEMVRSSYTAWKAREHFNDQNNKNEQPVWCYERFGMSITKIGDDEFIEIGGEHEDSYDPNFCIYNEVFHHKGNGSFDIYMYPKEIFPPTDNHSATLFNGKIYIIGSFGYHGERGSTNTPVYSLDINTFMIEKLKTTGDSPGWIFNHKAILQDDSSIRLNGGDIIQGQNNEEEFIINKFDYKLDITSLRWSKHDQQSLTIEPDFFPEDDKRFEHSNGTLLACKKGKQWNLIKILDVYRLDVSRDQTIIIEDSEVTSPVDDFIFLILYSCSDEYDSYDAINEIGESGNFKLESKCIQRRSSTFPKECRYISYQDVSKHDKQLVEQWKMHFNKNTTNIL